MAHVNTDPYKIQHNQLIWVRDSDDEEWRPRHFSGYDSRMDIIHCYKKDSAYSTIYWYQWTDVDPTLPEVVSYEIWFQ